MSGRTHERRTIGAARRPRRGEQCQTAAACELRLRPGRTRLMSQGEQEQLVSALAELLCDWLAEHPDRLPSRLRSHRQAIAAGRR
jgi:hypothetical protein